jgi:hypothetical protein
MRNKRHYIWTIVFLSMQCCFSCMLNAQEYKLGLPDGHDGLMRHMEFSPDGKFILTAADSPGGNDGITDETARLWETQTGRLLFTFQQKDDIKAIAFHPDGKTIAVTTGDELNIYNTTSGALLKSIRRDYEKFDLPESQIHFTPDGKSVWLAKPFAFYAWTADSLHVISEEGSFSSQSKDGKWVAMHRNDSLLVYEFNSQKPVFSFDMPLGKDKKISSSFNANSSRLMVYTDHSLLVYDVASGKPSLKYNWSFDIKDAQWHPEGRFIAVSSSSQIDILDVKTSKAVKKIPAQNYSINAAQWSADGSLFLVNEDSTRIYSTATGKLQYTIESDMNRLSADSKWLLINNDNKPWVSLYNAHSGRFQEAYYNHIRSVRFRNLNNNPIPYITSFSENVLRIWHPFTGELLHTLETRPKEMGQIELSSDGNYFLVYNSIVYRGDPSSVSVWDAKTDKRLYTMHDSLDASRRPEISTAKFSPDGKYVILSVYFTNEKTMEVFDTMTGKLLYRKDSTIITPKVTADSRYIYYGSEKGFHLAELASGKEVARVPGLGKLYSFTYQTITDKGDRILCSFNDKVYVIDVKRACVLYSIPGNNWQLDAEDKLLLTVKDSFVNIHSLSDGALIRTMKNMDSLSWDKKLTEALFSANGKYVIARSSYGNQLWETATGRPVAMPSTEIKEISWFRFIGNDRYMIVTEANPYIWDIEQGKKVAIIYAVDRDYIIQLQSGYYQASPGAARHLYYASGNKTISFDQLDIKYNRPDIVADSLARFFHVQSPVNVELLGKAYARRLKKLNLSQQDIDNPASIPEADIQNRESLPLETSDEFITLRIHATDSISPLKRINVWVNETPLFGKSGLALRPSLSVDTTIRVKLSVGMNHIETSVFNQRGVESYRRPVKIQHYPQGKIEKKLIFIGVAVDRYQEKSQNLRYTAKDVRELAEGFAKKYPTAIIDTLMNENVTREAVLALKEKLKAANENDVVIFSFSGHGLLDDSLNFYCATHDMDFRNPAKRGLAYEDIESMLLASPARQKLILMDACNSGEADDESVLKQQAEGNNEEGTKGGEMEVIERDKSFDLMNRLFAHNNDRNGLFVISAAGSKEAAFENEELGNGVFTYSVKKGLFEMEADKDNSNSVSINELKHFVGKKVQELTNGKQRPTSRKENFVSDWSLSDFPTGFTASALAAAFVDSAKAMEERSEIDKATGAYENARTAFKLDKNEFNYDYLWVSYKLSQLYASKEDYANALDLALETASRSEELKLVSDYYEVSINDLAWYAQQTKDYELAEGAFEELLNVYAEKYTKGSWVYAYALNRFGNMYYNQKDFESAVEKYEESKALLDELGKYQYERTPNWRANVTYPPKDYKQVLMNLANGLRKLKRYNEELVLRKDIVGFDREYNSPDDPLELNQVAITYQNLKDYANADSFYARSIALLEKGDTLTNDFIIILGNRAYLNREHNKHKLALSLYERRQQFYVNTNGSNLAAATYDLALAQEVAGKKEQAIKNYLQVTELLGSEKETNKLYGDALQRLKTLGIE